MKDLYHYPPGTTFAEVKRTRFSLFTTTLVFKAMTWIVEFNDKGFRRRRD